MFEAIDAFGDFEVHIPVVRQVLEAILLDKVVRNIGEFDAGILRSVEWCAKVEVGDVERCKACGRRRENTI